MTTPAMILLHTGIGPDFRPLCLPAGSFAFTKPRHQVVVQRHDKHGIDAAVGAVVWHPGESSVPHWFVLEAPEVIEDLLRQAGITVIECRPKKED